MTNCNILAEWALKSLQAEGVHYQQNDHAGLDSRINRDYGFYPGHIKNDRGRLIISATSTRFETNIGHRVIFVLDYAKIAKLEKIDRTKRKVIPGGGTGKDLRISSRLVDGQEWMLTDMDNRDQAFSQIVGFSKTTWQVVW